MSSSGKQRLTLTFFLQYPLPIQCNQIFHTGLYIGSTLSSCRLLNSLQSKKINTIFLIFEDPAGEAIFLFLFGKLIYCYDP